MRIGRISRKPIQMFYFIILGILAWLSLLKSVIFGSDMMVTMVAMIPLIPIILIPLVLLQNRIEIYKDRIKVISLFKKTTYPLKGVKRVSRKMIAENHVSDGEPQRFPKICLEYTNGKMIRFPFSLFSFSKDTKVLFNQIEQLNPDVQFDKDTEIIKSGQDHPMNKLLFFFTYGVGTMIYLFFILIGF